MPLATRPPAPAPARNPAQPAPRKPLPVVVVVVMRVVCVVVMALLVTKTWRWWREDKRYRRVASAEFEGLKYDAQAGTYEGQALTVMDEKFRLLYTGANTASADARRNSEGTVWDRIYGPMYFQGYYSIGVMLREDGTIEKVEFLPDMEMFID